MMNAIVTLMLFAAATDDAAALKDQQKFDGDWEVVRLEARGVPVKDSPIGGLTFKPFTKDAAQPGKAKGVFTYKLDPAKTPKRIDAIATLDEKDSMYGIYLLDGDTLKLCFSQAEKTRPTEFKTAADSDVLLLEFKRKPVVAAGLADIRAKYRKLPVKVLKMKEPVEVRFVGHVKARGWVWLLRDADGAEHTFRTLENASRPLFYTTRPEEEKGRELADGGAEEQELYGILLRWIDKNVTNAPQFLADPGRMVAEAKIDTAALGLSFYALEKRIVEVIEKGRR